MTFLLRNNDDEVSEGDTYYWKIAKLLQDISSRGSNGVVTAFKLHSKTWENLFIVFDDGFVYVRTTNFSKNEHLFDLRVGIIADDLKEIVSIKPHSLDKLIRRSELNTSLLSKRILYLFIEIRRKGENAQMLKGRK